ncbi:MAG: hypothetical protein QW228_01140 [Candidatus Aenigmatarchaeota archaeon]
MRLSLAARLLRERRLAKWPKIVYVKEPLEAAYDPTRHIIEIPRIRGPFTAFVAAHEFGHARSFLRPIEKHIPFPLLFHAGIIGYPVLKITGKEEYEKYLPILMTPTLLEEYMASLRAFPIMKRLGFSPLKGIPAFLLSAASYTVPYVVILRRAIRES